LQAFAFSAFVAAFTGALLTYQVGVVPYTSFDIFGSIALISLVYIGGVATVSGAVVAGISANGGVLFLFLTNQISGYPKYMEMIAGGLLILTVILQPDGVVVAVRRDLGRLIRLVKSRTGRPAAPSGTSTGPKTEVLTPDVHAVTRRN
jgi:branched-chain amino acid transport system permease protein